MAIQLDPTRWLVSFAGFIADWVLSREWKRIGLASLPLLFLVTVAGLVFAGSRLDKHELANRYLALGENEIADWEASWTSKPIATEKTTAAATRATESPEDATKQQESTDASEGKKQRKELSRFAEVLFRRVQQLEPSERSQFVIGVTMAQRGATGQARKMFSKIAPDDRPGYSPAHAWLASNLLTQNINNENIRVVKHHVTEAAKWDRVPEAVLLGGAQLFFMLGEQARGLDLFKKAAEVNPFNNLTLAQLLAQLPEQLKNPVLEKQTVATAISYFRQELEENPNDLKNRLGLVQSLAQNKQFDEAEQVVRAGMQLSPSPELTRGLSEVYRLRYVWSLKLDGETWSGDLQMLDLALRTDPTNPMIAEEIAKLARLNGASPGDELFDKLRQFLAEGKATAATHAWLAELYLIRKNYAQAVPHLEQVVTRLPNAAQYLNNLAYVLAEIAPERLPEALTMAQRAVQVEPRSADYFDTLAMVLDRLNRRTEAIAAIESAIERQPQRVDFHERAIALYGATGDLNMAEQHRNLIKRIAEHDAKVNAELAAAKQAAALQAAALQAVSAEKNASTQVELESEPKNTATADKDENPKQETSQSSSGPALDGPVGPVGPQPN